MGSDYDLPPAYGIVVEKDEITVDGNERLLQGVGGDLVGTSLSSRSLVAVENAQIENFGTGIRLDSLQTTLSTRTTQQNTAMASR